MQRVIILCDGMPSIPPEAPLAEFLAGKGYWVFYPRYRGAWESGGEFLKRSPDLDILDVIGGLSKEFGNWRLGGDFGWRLDEAVCDWGKFWRSGGVSLSLDPRVKKVIANCPVVDWAILSARAEERDFESELCGLISARRLGMGIGCRISNWKKLSDGKFYNPVCHARPKLSLRR